jgi:hypothetical protein
MSDTGNLGQISGPRLCCVKNIKKHLEGELRWKKKMKRL